MITKKEIEKARKNIPWKFLDQVEQDLLIGRSLVALYNNPIVRDTLVFRGGTALNKLFLNPPARYSEDIDFVQRRKEGIGPSLGAIRDSMDWFLRDAGIRRPRVDTNKYGSKLFYRFPNIDGNLSTLKLEINTREHFHVDPLKEVHFSISSGYFSGNTSIVTYSLEELMGTKLRAVYQRRKGRDLFDAWHVFSKGLADLEKVVHIFHRYNDFNGTKITRKMFQQNMEGKQHNTDFRQDISALLPSDTDYSFDEAYDFFMRKIVPLI